MKYRIEYTLHGQKQLTGLMNKRNADTVLKQLLKEDSKAKIIIDKYEDDSNVMPLRKR